jgi:hypothetical protein
MGVPPRCSGSPVSDAAVRRIRAGLALVFATASATPASAQLVQLPPSIEFRVPKPPTLARGADGAFLAWELHITNLTPGAVSLRSVEVLDAAGPPRPLAVLQDSALLRILARPGTPLGPEGRARIEGGLRAVVYFWLPVDAAPVPGSLLHRLTFATDTATDAIVVLTGAQIPVQPAPPPMGAPLRGEWVALNGPSNMSGHRRLVMALNGSLASGQRFGADFLRVDDAGSSFRGDRLRNDSYYAYGQDVFAVADGVVVETKDGIPDNVPGPQSRAVPITLETVGGNYILLELGPQRYAFYAHLLPGSLRVRPGDRVRRGQLIGRVGNSGNSTEPHLHFHVVDGIAAGTTTLGAEGVPYVLDGFELRGTCTASIGASCRRMPPRMLLTAMPMQNQIVNFPDDVGAAGAPPAVPDRRPAQPRPAPLRNY